ncbi:GDSL esterase/lipase At4g16230-like [Nymphaea colorata]|nr:GDSL esterase/lipase At4g16230-like [Nymphaea colorata]
MASFSWHCLALELCFAIIGVGLCRVCYARFYPASFVFGDSLVDAGNNNFLISLSKANYLPNGIDFGMPSGRYTNGRTIPDIIGQELGGLPGFSPPYLDPSTKGAAVLHGVNYASGGGGILNFTGKVFGGRLSLDAQLDNLANTQQDLITYAGMDATRDIFHDSIFSITMGANDFINNYLFPIKEFSLRPLLTPGQFTDAMISKYRLQLTRLHEMGARKIIVVNVGPIGCIPYLRELYSPPADECAAQPNQLAQNFNVLLRGLVSELSENLPQAKFVYADVYRIVADIIQNYRSYGFEVADSACCFMLGKYGGLIPCGLTSKVCPDRSKYVFWDPYHPSDATNQIIAKRLLDGGPEDIYPINIRQLASL